MVLLQKAITVAAAFLLNQGYSLSFVDLVARRRNASWRKGTGKVHRLCKTCLPAIPSPLLSFSLPKLSSLISKDQLATGEQNRDLLMPRPPSPGGSSLRRSLVGNEAALFSRAKEFLASDLGMGDGSLLAQDFIWIAPNIAPRGLGKEDYLAAGRFFDLR